METNVEENRKILKDSEHAAQMCQVEEVANANIVSRLLFTQKGGVKMISPV